MINSEDDDFTQIIKESINRNPEDNSFAIQVNGVTHVFLKSDIPAMIEAVEDIEYEAFWGKPKKKKNPRNHLQLSK